MADYFVTLSEAVQDGDDKKVEQTVKNALKGNVSPTDILDKGLVPGIQALGERFKDGEVYLPEILISVRAMNRGVDLLNPLLVGKESKKLGIVVLGTVEGDLHDIGKNLVKLMLEGNGFRVIDLGVDVPPSNFVDAVREHHPDILAVSALLTLTMANMPAVIEALNKAGIRNTVKIMIGGAPTTRQFADSIGIEGYADDCVTAVDEAKRLMQVK